MNYAHFLNAKIDSLATYDSLFLEKIDNEFINPKDFFIKEAPSSVKTSYIELFRRNELLNNDLDSIAKAATYNKRLYIILKK